MHTLGIVQPPSRVQGETVDPYHKLDGKSLLEWVVRRATDAQRLDKVVVVLGTSAEDQRLAELVPADVEVFTSRGIDELARSADAARTLQADAVVRISVESPFLDPALIDRLVAEADEHPQCDYISYCAQQGQPIVLSAMGIFAEWCRATALDEASRVASDTKARAEVTSFLYSHPEKFNIRLIAAPEGLEREDALSMRSQTDWEMARAIYESLGPEQLEWQRIAQLFRDHPALKELTESGRT